MESQLGSKCLSVKLASSKILWERIDSSTLVINLENGSYYNLEQTSSELWSLLMAGLSVEELVNALREQSGGVGSIIATEVTSWVDRLAAEGLVVLSREESTEPHRQQNSEVEIKLSNYSKVELHKFTDLETLLLADPIHEFNFSDQK